MAVTDPPPTLSFTATPNSISSGSIRNARLVLDQREQLHGVGWLERREGHERQPVHSRALAATTTFTLACTGAGDSTYAVTDRRRHTHRGATVSINAGGPAVTGYVADAYYSGGAAYTFGNVPGV